MKTTITALENAGLRQQVKVLVGGAPVTSQYAQQIGADAYGENANSAVTLARKMVTHERTAGVRLNGIRGNSSEQLASSGLRAQDSNLSVRLPRACCSNPTNIPESASLRS